MKSKTILITGATSGIGKATALLLSKQGHNMIITGRREQKLKEVATKIQDKYKRGVLTCAFDVRDLEEVTSVMKVLKKKIKKIDVLINNAGLAKGKDPIHRGKIEDWETMIDTNVKGLLYMTRLISPGMVKRKSGHIINVASSAGKDVYPDGNVYCATKHAVDALTKAMRIDLHKHGIKVGQVAPGHVEDTEFAKVRFDGDDKKAKIYDDFIPTNSKDIARMIAFMISQPKHVNIQDLLVMGTQQANSLFIDKSGRS